ncbi:MAG: S-layer homology domain-containing protein [Clostridia bacterium]|nr:S-layer homology domain-containing protein [Clostridia bacterium]
MKKWLIVMMISIGLSFSMTSAMEYSVTDAGVEFQNAERAMIGFTFNNKTDGYHAEMYYIPRLTVLETYPNSSFSFFENYAYFEPVSFSIGANESKELKYDCVLPKNLASGNYAVSIDFYERTNKISEYSTNIRLDKITTPIQTSIYNINDFEGTCIMVDNVSYGSKSGPTVNKDSQIQAQLNLILNSESKKRVIPKITIYERTMLGGVVSTSYGKAFDLQPKEESTILIDLPRIEDPESYLVHLVLLDENSNQVSKTYEFRYVVPGAAANVTYLGVKKDLTITAGVVGPADASILMNCKIICNIYDSKQNLLNTQNEIITLSYREKEMNFSLANVPLEDNKAFVEIIVEHAGKVLATKKNEVILDELEGKKEAFSDITGTKYENAVTLLNSLGILNGYPDGTFRPENSITRAEFTVIANKLANLDSVKITGRFTDCDLHWARQYIEAAAKNNILSGYPDGTFRPDNLVTYSEGVTILLNMRGYKEEINKSTFSWPYNYLNKAKSVGLLNSIETENYSTPANRGDVAIMALNAYLMTR